jgi:hypothetical protein
LRKWIGCLAAMVLVACAGTSQTDAVRKPAERLSTQAPAYIMVAEDGTYGGRRYSGSGRMLSQATLAQVARHITRVQMGEGLEKLEQALQRAQAGGYRYVFEPTILAWEDRATEWSMISDKITIKMVVWDAASGKDLASSIVSASSSLATFGGDHPQDLLPGALSRMIPEFF